MQMINFYTIEHTTDIMVRYQSSMQKKKKEMNIKYNTQARLFSSNE